MQTTIQKWGNSHAIRIPMYIMSTLSIKEHDSVDINIEKDKIVITKIEQIKRKTIEQLFANCSDDYEHEIFDYGKPVGGEVW